MYLRSSSTYLKTLSASDPEKYYRALGNILREHLLRDRLLDVIAIHLLLALWALDMWREDCGLNLRLDPLLQASLACVDQMVAG